MPITKYRSVEEMDAEREWLPTGDPAIARKMRYLWDLSEALLGEVGTCIPRGVRKFRSIEEANADQDRCEQDRVDRLRAVRSRK